MYERIVIVIFCSNQCFPSPDPLPTIADFVRTQGFHFAILSPLLRLWSQKTKRKSTKTQRQKTKTKTSSQPGFSFKPSSHICVLFMLKILKMLISFTSTFTLDNPSKIHYRLVSMQVIHYPKIIQVHSSSQSSFIKLFSWDLTRVPTLFPWFPR